jgi:DNA segregation ATPase FtsK/SpoIIIE, S-DNA-T family
MVKYREKRANDIRAALEKSGAKHIQALRILDRAEDRARQAFIARWTDVKIKSASGYKDTITAAAAGSVHGTGSSAKRMTAQQVAADLDAKTRDYPRSLPSFARTRGRAYASERAALEETLTAATAARMDILEAVRRAIRGNVGVLPKVFKSDRQAVDGLHRALARALPAGIADRGDPGLARCARSLNSYTVQVGQVTELPFEVYQQTQGPDSVGLALAQTPVLLDLHAGGGLVTDSAATLMSVVVRLLAMNPAGSLKLQVFDRQSYGKIVDYLLDLDEDVQKPLLVGPIATSAADLRSALDEIEQHIGFITQKYLAGKHKSLFDYNASAGSMTEPSRLLILAGYPDGFVETYGLDGHLSDQLNRIISAGPSAGVYTLVLVKKGYQAGLALPSFVEGAVDSAHWPRPISAAAATFAPGRTQARQGYPAVAWGQQFHESAGNPQLIDDLRAKGASAFFSVHSAVAWHPAPSLDKRQVDAVMARLAQDIIATPARRVASADVARLAAAKGIFVDPADPATWWAGSSRELLEAPVGTRGTKDVQRLYINSSVANNGLLVGGRAGSGKSTFLHALITELGRRYSPDELQLCLLDLKFGVEFSAYRQLPHAKIVGLETGVEFGTSVLEGLITEIDRRSALFTSANVSNLKDYREKTGATLPRMLVVLDEFTFAFENQGRENTAFGVALQRIIKQGRAFGVHYVLATQSIAHGFDVPRDALKEVPMRVALQSDETASRLLLSDDNPAAALIEHPGEAIFNGSNGQRSANTPFQTTWVGLSDAEKISSALARKWSSSGHRAPVRVFDTRQPADFPRAIGKLLAAPALNGPLQIPLGLPFGLGKAVAVKLARAAGGNLLAVVPQRTAPALAGTALTSALSPSSRVFLVDFAGLASDVSTACEPIVAQARKAGLKISVPLGNQVENVIERLAELARKRQDQGSFTEPPITLILTGLERANALAQGRDAQAQLQELVSQGPVAGIHTVAITDRYANFERKLGGYVLDEFDHRVIGPLSTDHSLILADTSDTSQLSATKLTYYDRGRGVGRRVLAFSMPPAGMWG